MLNKKILSSTAWVVFWLVIVIGIVEFSLMFILSTVTALPPAPHALSDALILVILIAPLLYWYIARRQRAEEELRKHRDHLEEVVKERTAELVKTNQQLQDEVTGHQRAEDRLQEMALFAELNPAPVLSFDDKGIVLSANSAAVAILGKRTRSVTPLTLLLPSLADVNLKQCVELGLTMSHEVAIGERHFLFTIQGVPELNIGHIYGADITQQKRREELQARFELVFNSVGDGVYVTDTDCQVLLWNRGAERITGWSAQEAIGKPCAQLLAKEDEAGNRLCDTPLCPMRSALSSGEASQPKRVLEHTADGRLIPIAVSTAPLKSKEGTTIGIVEVFRDISRELEIEQMKSDFVSTVSHELRTPLASIQGFTELLLIRDVSAER